jgi:hypothetical protein
LSGIELTDGEAMLFAKLPNLKEVDLFECTAIGDVAVVALASKCIKIESLTLGGSLRR